MKQILATGNIQLTKSLGQNFLHDANQLRCLVKAAQLAHTDPVLEIGPGLGPLTELLLAKAKHVLAIEIDRRLVDFLQQRFSAAAHLTLVHADALTYLRQEKRDWSDWKLVANLPFSAASPLLVELALAAHGPRRMVVTLQQEVAGRLVAQAGDPAYGVLTLLVNLHYESRGCFKIPATCFFPEPEVGSACITLERRPQPLLDWEHTALFAALVKLSFSQRRKMMLKLLKSEWPAAVVESAFAAVKLAPQTRAETVNVEQFARLTRILHTCGRPETQNVESGTGV